MSLGNKMGLTMYGSAPQRENGIARIKEWSQKVRILLLPAEPIFQYFKPGKLSNVEHWRVGIRRRITGFLNAQMINLGANDAVIRDAEQKLGVIFPETLCNFYRLSNGMEVPPDWQVYAVFDPANPRKSANHMVYANTTGRWSYMPQDLICIAGNGAGNQLVLKKLGQTLGGEIFVWDHEGNNLRKWTRTLDFLVTEAQKRVAKIEKQIQKAKRGS